MVAVTLMPGGGISSTWMVAGCKAETCSGQRMVRASGGIGVAVGGGGGGVGEGDGVIAGVGVGGGAGMDGAQAANDSASETQIRIQGWRDMRV